MNTIPTQPNKAEKIKITFSYWTTAGVFGERQVIKELTSASSVREKAYEIIQELKNEIPDLGGVDPIDQTPLSIYVSNDRMKNIYDGWNETHEFGIKYALNSDGSLQALTGFRTLSYDWTLGEIKELLALGYIKGDVSHLIIGIPEGLGAGGADFFILVGFLADILSLKDEGLKGLKFITQFFKYRSIRKIAKTWSEHGIRYPEQLRVFIDEKARWQIEEVCERLKISREFGYKLLIALGLEPVGDFWQLTQSNKSITKRKAWIRNEKKYQKLLEKKMAGETGANVV